MRPGDREPVFLLILESHRRRLIDGGNISGFSRIRPRDIEKRHRLAGLHALIRRAAENFPGVADGNGNFFRRIILRRGRVRIQRRPRAPRIGLVARFPYLGKVNRNRIHALIGHVSDDLLFRIVFGEIDVNISADCDRFRRLVRISADRVRLRIDFDDIRPIGIRHMPVRVKERHRVARL